ncbi:DNA primase family protein [Oceanobacillus damuensis]|uniref:DNA primase family protein n=1 Tax=Oceanobacillus damuensis TaxID=937928 RepID=UPI00082D20D5|nr:phage/plasmid primase, P4 family [Oceanobacillus damuensis]
MHNESHLNEYVSSYPIKKVRLLESSETIRSKMQSIDVKENLSLIVTAIKIVAFEEGAAFFSALMYHIYETSKQAAIELYNNAELVPESLVPTGLLDELKLILTVGKAEERGFFYDERKNSYTFNANAFAKHFIKRCSVRSTKDGRLFLYHRKGIFEELSEVELGKVIRTLMHEGRWNSWNSKSETEVVKALLRESNTVGEMNSNRNFINLRNGMLSLDNFELFPHHPSYLSTVQLPINYDSNAVASSFMRFLKEITLDDEELIRVHQEILGYLLSAETKAEKAFFFYGSGANGKSVLASIITQLVGKENVSSIPLAEFSQQFGLEGLVNKTVNIAAENEMGGKSLKTENFKAIVSGDTVTINIKYRPAITYKPYCKLVFVVNNLPDSMDVTNGYFRKLMLIPFSRTFKPTERNVNLTQELLAELPGILNWAIEGLKRLRENNYQFSECKVIEECHRTYYVEQNPVMEFFNEHVVLIEGVRTRQSDFHEKYLRWLTMQGIDDKGTKSKQNFWRYFKIVLENEGIPIVKKKVRGTIYFDGLEIVGLDNLQVPVLNGEIIQF